MRVKKPSARAGGQSRLVWPTAAPRLLNTGWAWPQGAETLMAGEVVVGEGVEGVGVMEEMEGGEEGQQADARVVGEGVWRKWGLGKTNSIKRSWSVCSDRSIDW